MCFIFENMFIFYITIENFIEIRIIGTYKIKGIAQNNTKYQNLTLLCDSVSFFQRTTISLYFLYFMKSNANIIPITIGIMKKIGLSKKITFIGSKKKVKIKTVLMVHTNKNARNSGFLSLAVLYIH